MIHPLMVDMLLNYAQGLSTKAVVKIDGIEHQYDYYRTMRDGNTIKKYVYINDRQGAITEAHAVDALGRHLESYTAQINKGPDGFMIVFLLTLKIEGTVVA